MIVKNTTITIDFSLSYTEQQDILSKIEKVVASLGHEMHKTSEKQHQIGRSFLHLVEHHEITYKILTK